MKTLTFLFTIMVIIDSILTHSHKCIHDKRFKNLHPEVIPTSLTDHKRILTETTANFHKMRISIDFRSKFIANGQELTSTSPSTIS